MTMSFFDLKSPAVWNIRLADDYPAAQRPHFASIRYNHRPKISASEHVKIDITQKDGNSTLKLEEGRSVFGFKGQYEATDDDAYVLVVSGDGREKELVLHKLDAAHVYNLNADPEGTEAEELLRRYPELSLADDGEDDLFGDSDDDTDMPIDRDNPFDFRHYLNTSTDVDELEGKGISKEADTASSAVGTPRTTTRPQPNTAAAKKLPNNTRAISATTPSTRAVAQKGTSIFNKRKAAGASKSATKRVKAGDDHEARSTPTSNPVPGTSRPSIPKVRLDRKASIRPPVDDDEGELILENETPVTTKPHLRNSAMSLALSGQLGQGPISLRSAASSPAGRLASASPNGFHDNDLDVEVEGSISPDELAARGSIRSQKHAIASSRHAQSSRQNNYDEDDDDDAAMLETDEADGDRSPRGLVSPAIHPATSPHGADGGREIVDHSFSFGDDDDDLDKQLKLAFENEDDIPGTLPANASDEESEEE